MNNKVASLVLTAVLVSSAAVALPQGAEAKNSQNGFPGNSYYGRSHNPHFNYKWGNEEFETFDELVQHVRDYMEALREQLRERVRTRSEIMNDQSEVDVETERPDDVDDTSARLVGSVDLNDSEYADVWFKYGTSYPGLDEETEEIRIDEDDDEDFDVLLQDLEPDTRYFYRAYARDDEDDVTYGILRSFVTKDDQDDDSNDDADDDSDAPAVVTYSARDVTHEGAELRGRVSMNDYENGRVFFVYGTDVDLVDDVRHDYDTYASIDTEGSELMKVSVDSDLDGATTYEHIVDDLATSTKYYYAIGVEYEEDDDDTLLVGGIRSFTTDDE